MSLIQCPDCKKQISRRAVSCPYCGCPAEFFCNFADETATKKKNDPRDTLPKAGKPGAPGVTVNRRLVCCYSLHRM